jgi:hypothetical protein
MADRTVIFSSPNAFYVTRYQQRDVVCCIVFSRAAIFERCGTKDEQFSQKRCDERRKDAFSDEKKSVTGTLYHIVPWIGQTGGIMQSNPIQSYNNSIDSILQQQHRQKD